MFRVAFRPIAAILFALAVAAQTQTPIPVKLPNGTVGLPYEANLADPVIAELPPESTLQTILLVAPNNLPPGMSLASNGKLAGVPTTAANYSFTVNGRVSVLANNAIFTSSFFLQVSWIVDGKTGGLTVGAAELGLAGAAGGVAVSKGLPLINTGPAVRAYSVSASSTGGWLSVSPMSGRLGAFSDTVITVTATPGRLAAGLYRGTITISTPDTAERITIPVTFSVSAPEQTLSVSQTGMTFTVEQGQAAPPAQLFQVRSTSRTGETYSTAPFQSAPAGAASWISATPATGTVGAGRPANLSVRVNPAGLTPGTYYGHIDVSAGRANASRLVAVVLNVLPPNSPLVPEIRPAGLALIQRVTRPVLSQTVTLSNVNGRPLTAALSAEFEGTAQNWFTVSPANVTIPSGQSANLTVARATSVRLPAGVYRGSIAVRAAGSVRRIAILGIVVPGAETLTPSGRVLSADGCTPTSLEPVSTTLALGFSTVTAWPIALRTLVLDNCGDPMDEGAVSASFTNGDPPLSLSPEGEGVWAGSWVPRSSGGNTVITITAVSLQPASSGSWQLGGAVGQNPALKPVIEDGGVQSAASQVPERRIAPGSFIAIRGSDLAADLVVAPDGSPFPTRVGDTFAVLSGGFRIPLYFAAPTISAGVVPFNFPQTSGVANLILYRGTAPSQVVEVNVTAVQPGIFTQNATGKGLGSILRYRDSPVPVKVDAANRVRPGDVIAIYGAGFGPLTRQIDAGAIVPLSAEFQTREQPVVTIGGLPASIAYSGMVPTTPAGLYVVNAVVPEGLPRNRDVDVVVTVGGESSQPVTLPVE